MNRGEIWTAAGGSDHAGKPRPVLIVQADEFDATASITVCLLTTEDIGSPLFRIEIPPAPTNGLRATSFVMVDKISSLSRERLRQRIGLLTATEMTAVNRSIAVFVRIGVR
ncbi:MAG TPA: type II toxin-antitoxin system PemK/MazF family toxin [Sphingomicrobium sp.]|jgi:mRNA interferase MazF|nr:type II toxin-antitoxin system PemK/MazF family toxin [Sphingomicrobium sp.]